MMTSPIHRPTSPTLQQWHNVSQILLDECYKRVDLSFKAHLTVEMTSCIKRFQDASALGMEVPTADMLYHSNHLLGVIQGQATMGEGSES